MRYLISRRITLFLVLHAALVGATWGIVSWAVESPGGGTVGGYGDPVTPPPAAANPALRGRSVAIELISGLDGSRVHDRNLYSWTTGGAFKLNPRGSKIPHAFAPDKDGFYIVPRGAGQSGFEFFYGREYELTYGPVQGEKIIKVTNQQVKDALESGKPIQVVLDRPVAVVELFVKDADGTVKPMAFDGAAVVEKGKGGMWLTGDIVNGVMTIYSTQMCWKAMRSDEQKTNFDVPLRLDNEFKMDLNRMLRYDTDLDDAPLDKYKDMSQRWTRLFPDQYALASGGKLTLHRDPKTPIVRDKWVFEPAKDWNLAVELVNARTGKPAATDATVWFRDEAGQKIQAKQETGRFLFPKLKPASGDLLVEARGFEPGAPSRVMPYAGAQKIELLPLVPLQVDTSALKETAAAQMMLVQQDGYGSKRIREFTPRPLPLAPPAGAIFENVPDRWVALAVISKDGDTLGWTVRARPSEGKLTPALEPSVACAVAAKFSPPKELEAMVEKMEARLFFLDERALPFGNPTVLWKAGETHHVSLPEGHRYRVLEQVRAKDGKPAFHVIGELSTVCGDSKTTQEVTVFGYKEGDPTLPMSVLFGLEKEQ